MNPQKVVAGIIEKEGLILIAQRNFGPLAGKWEFPGGKVENTESPQEALVREIQEEFDVQVEVGDYIHKVPFEIDGVKYELIGYRAKYVSGEFKLGDHKQIDWVRPDILKDIDLAPADIPIAQKVVR